MKYISAKEFLKADIEVQESILEWWKPSKGDIYCNLHNNQGNNIMVVNDFELNYLMSFEKDIKNFGVPLLTEGQLRKFIEEKTDGNVNIAYIPLKEGYEIDI